MQPISATVGPLATADADGICQSQTPSGAGALTINGALSSGGVATLDVARRVLITAVGNESGKTFTIVGTSYNGRVQSETITGPNATTAQSVLDYKTVTSVTISAAAANAVTIGTNGVASSRWMRLDNWAFPQVGIQCDVSGTVNYTVQQTLDDPNDPTNPVAASAVNWVNHPDVSLVGATATVQGNYGYAPLYMRVTMNSGTGSVATTVVQYNNVSL
jgi:hypothetical protein